MPQSHQIEKIRQALLKRHKALSEALSADLRGLKELCTETSEDTAGLQSTQETINSQLVETQGRKLERIEYALERIKNGKFGICEDCGNKIPIVRLTALPYATRCISCQRIAEKNGAVTVLAENHHELIENNNDEDLSLEDIDPNDK